MAMEFTQFFIQEDLHALAKLFIPGLFNIIGFDNPKNDALAMRSGRDMARYFTAGYMAEQASLNMVAMPQLVAGGGGGAGGGGTTIIVNGAMSHDFVNYELAPRIEESIRTGQSKIAAQQYMRTGRKDGLRV
jgi:hypothetical protein